jgi:hypothetical protein
MRWKDATLKGDWDFLSRIRKLISTVRSNMTTCTYCGGTKWYEGPSGGAATNILCANEKCRHWFNISPFGLDDLKRVEPTAEEKTKAQSDARAVADNARLKCYNEGRAFYQAGKSTRDCINILYGGYALAGDDALRMCGFIDALAEDVRGTPRDETIAGTTTILG